MEYDKKIELDLIVDTFLVPEKGNERIRYYLPENYTEDDVINFVNNNIVQRDISDDFKGIFYSIKDGKMTKGTWWDIKTLNMLKKCIDRLSEKYVGMIHALCECQYEQGLDKYTYVPYDRISKKMTELGYEPLVPRKNNLHCLIACGVLDVLKSGLRGRFKLVPETVPVIMHLLGKIHFPELDNVTGGTTIEKDTKSIDIPDNIFDSIVGYDKYKKSMLRCLRAKKPVHVLLIGPPGTAKTIFLLALSKHIKDNVYLRGEHKLTKAGLVELLQDDPPFLLLIDEVTKMDASDRATLLGVTDEGIVTVLKHGERDRIKVDTRVWCATAEPYKLSREFISRFRVYKFREYTKEEFINVVKHFLPSEEGVDKELAEYIAIKLSDITRDVREAIKLGRICSTKEDVDEEVKLIKESKEAPSWSI